MDRLLEELSDRIGRDHVLAGQAAAEFAFSPWTRLGVPRAVLRPASTEEVSQIMRLAHAARAPVVAWGGRTGLVDGCRAEDALALSFDRMRAVEEIDRRNLGFVLVTDRRNRLKGILTDGDVRRWVWNVLVPEGVGATWAFEIEPARDGVLIRQWGRMGPDPSGLSLAIAARPELEGRIVSRRLGDWEQGMRANLDYVRAALEDPERA